MNLKECQAQCADSYFTTSGELHETLPCERGVLRVGVFFDGTGNHMKRPNTYSNVARLARSYRIDQDNRTVRWLYVRGPGTDGGITGNPLGNAFGRGGQKRVFGAMHCLQQIIEEFHHAHQSYPEKILLDVFGFSRGAALARHFVNVIKQGAFRMDATYRRIPRRAFRIGFLGVFDTVGSFGLPGNDTDLGYAFHVAPHWLECGGLHLVADDEHRENFSLHSILPRQDREHPRDMADGTLSEVVLPGAHSDIGGGYPPELKQGLANNELQRIACERMYDEARERTVPLDSKNAPAPKDGEATDAWSPDSRLSSSYARLMGLYQTQVGLRSLHRRWRVLNVGHEGLSLKLRRLERELDGPGATRNWQRVKRFEHDQKRLADIASTRKEVEQEMQGCFDRRKDYEAFMALANDFYASWVHRSHHPHNGAIGMEPGLHVLEGRRSVFLAGLKDLLAEKAVVLVSPRAFKDGAWMDRICLEVHG